MDADRIVALISAVERRKSIYDKRSPKYCNRSFINNEWKKIAEEVGCREDEVRKRWKKLRDYFQKNHREINQSEGGKKRKWYLYDRMHFILPYISDRNSASNVQQPGSSDEEDVDDEDNMSQASASSFTSAQHTDIPTLATDETIKQEPSVHHLTTPDTLSQATPDTLSQTTPDTLSQATPDTLFQHQHDLPRRRPKLFPQHRAQQSEFESEMLKAAQRLGTKQIDTETDEDEYFFKNLIPKMKLLNIVDKMECQAEIHMVVLKYVKKAVDKTA